MNLTLEEVFLSIIFFAIVFAMVSVINSLRYRAKKIIVAEFPINGIEQDQLVNQCEMIQKKIGCNVIGCYSNDDSFKIRSI